jgi:RNA polymerase sigma factor for flagellar operon FliA
MAMQAVNAGGAPPELVARAEELESLWQAWGERRDLDARNRLATLYYPLVRNIARMMARSLTGRGDLGDLESFGSEGLLAAIERFDPARGFDFSGFAAYRIRYSILDGVRSADWVPRSVRDYERHLRAVEEESFARNGRAPSAEEQANELGVSPDELRRMKGLTARTVLSTIAPSPDQHDGWSANDPVAEGADPLGAAMAREVMDAVREGLARLPDRQRTVIALSLDGGATLAEIGRHLGVTESRACQIRTSGMRTLRSYLTERGVVSA